MKDDPAFIYARLRDHDEWEERGEKSYDVEDLRQEYRKQYSAAAVEMIDKWNKETNGQIEK